MEANMRTLLERFDEKYIPEPMSGCWLWTGSLAYNGYGRIWLDGRAQYAHRVSYELFRESVPNDICVLHTCDVPSCVNPDHFFLGTYKDNHADMMQKGRGVFVNGQQHGKAKLTESQILDIRASNETTREIAARHDISQQQVSRIKTRKQWAHV